MFASTSTFSIWLKNAKSLFEHGTSNVESRKSCTLTGAFKCRSLASCRRTRKWSKYPSGIRALPAWLNSNTMQRRHLHFLRPVDNWRTCRFEPRCAEKLSWLLACLYLKHHQKVPLFLLCSSRVRAQQYWYANWIPLMHIKANLLEAFNCFAERAKGHYWCRWALLGRALLSVGKQSILFFFGLIVHLILN